MNSDPAEYDCRDCGIHVYAFGRDVAPEPPLCAVCAWLDEFVPDRTEREAFRSMSDPLTRWPCFLCGGPAAIGGLLCEGCRQIIDRQAPHASRVL